MVKGQTPRQITQSGVPMLELSAASRGLEIVLHFDRSLMGLESARARA